MQQFSFLTAFGYFNLSVEPDVVGLRADGKKVAGALTALTIASAPEFKLSKSNAYIEWLQAWEGGDATALNHVPVQYPTSEFRTLVSIAMRNIPAGHVLSYAELAAAAMRPAAVRAAASVCARNPIPIVIPCHRVVRSDGSLGNYFYGTELKDRLLRSEGWR